MSSRWISTSVPPSTRTLLRARSNAIARPASRSSASNSSAGLPRQTSCCAAPVVARLVAARAARALADRHAAARLELARLALARRRRPPGARRPTARAAPGAPRRRCRNASVRSPSWSRASSSLGGDRDRLLAIERAEPERRQVGPDRAGGAPRRARRERGGRAARARRARHGRCSTRTLPSSSKRRSCT